MDVKMPQGIGRRMKLVMLIGTHPKNLNPITLTLRAQIPTSSTFDVVISHKGEVKMTYTALGSNPSNTPSKNADGASTYFYTIVFDVDDQTELMVFANGTEVLENRTAYPLAKMDVLRVQEAHTGWRLYEMHVVGDHVPVFPGSYMHWRYPRLSMGTFIELRGNVSVSGDKDKLELFHNGQPFGHIDTDSTWHEKTVTITLRFGMSTLTVSSSLGPTTFINNVPLREPDLGSAISIFSFSSKFTPHNAIITPGFWGEERLFPF